MMPPLCRALARTGVCRDHVSGRCAFRHTGITAAELALAAAAADKQSSLRAAERHEGDPWGAEHKAGRRQRARVFASWLVDTFGLQGDAGAGTRARADDASSNVRQARGKVRRVQELTRDGKMISE